MLLVTADLNWSRMRDVRSHLSLVITPLQWLVDVPSKVAMSVSDLLVGRTSLLEDNARLKMENLQLEQKVQQMAALTAENVRLRELLNSRETVNAPVVLAELIGVNPDPFQHQVILNRGSEDGAYLGQPVLDAGGVMGQVVEVNHYTSRVMLITDARHALPVAVNRNGLRSIALGNGTGRGLELEHVADTADIKVGDLIVTSGLGGRFPSGYPVARVTEVVRDPGQPFSMVTLEPSARLDRSRHLLMVEQLPDPARQELRDAD